MRHVEATLELADEQRPRDQYREKEDRAGKRFNMQKSGASMLPDFVLQLWRQKSGASMLPDFVSLLFCGEAQRALEHALIETNSASTADQSESPSEASGKEPSRQPGN